MSRVLLVGKGPPDHGGIPTFIELLRSGELSMSHDFTFLNVAHASTPQGGKATASNVLRTLRDAIAVWRAAGDQDIVHIHSALAPAVTVARAGLLALAGRTRGRAVIVHAHGGNVEHWLVNSWRRRLMRLAMAPASKVVAVWTIGERALRSTLGGNRVCLIDNGVDLVHSPAPREPKQSPVILYVGLLTPRKGVLDLLEASRIVSAEGLDHEVWLLGGTPDEGPEAAEPIYAAARGTAQLLGTRPSAEMPAAYSAADIFCLPSWWEAMPLSVLEAMAQGLPVVATDVGDVARAVQDGVTGFVVPVQSPQQLADALARLLKDAELRARMGAAGRGLVADQFSSSVTARQLDSLYEAVQGAATR